MIDKILIANRGEIACRIIRACKKLQIATVAVYSDADKNSLHKQLADEAVYIGKAAVVDSYLHAGKIIEAALSTGCQAIHPGYGFLSENAAFARQITSSGLIFIGPPAEIIALMGDKIAAKELAISAGLPVIPGHMEALANEDEALAVAQSIGFPVLFKPAAGGGGKGMRVVKAAGDVEAAFGACRQETRKAFGDARIFVERYIESPRHIEVQILADAHGNIVHLGERECSIQRRHQKIIEESPSPVLSDAQRSAICKAACDLASKAGYVNAGTVEFIYDHNGAFYFLEMNTRLQVEHPVTEAVTGLDLVEQQIRIASLEPLSFSQDDIIRTSWAMEARICAEDPQRAFLPATGMITRYAEPRGETVRVDSGIQMGSKIGIHYDSLLAKVIARGKTRDEARALLMEALNGYHIEGVVTNLDFVNSILCQPAFIRGELSTNFLEDHYDGAASKYPPDPEALSLTALAATLIYHVRTIAVRKSIHPPDTDFGTSRPRPNTSRYKVKSEDDVFDIRLTGTLKDNHWIFSVNGRNYDVEAPPFELYRRRLKLDIDGRTRRFRIVVEPPCLRVAFNGMTRLFDVLTPREYFLMHFMPCRTAKIPDNQLICPMPGMVVDVLVGAGERVYRGQNLILLESMKLESGVPSPIDATVSDIRVKPGQTVEAGSILMTFSK